MLLGLFAAVPALSIDISAPTLALLPEALGTSAMVAGLTLASFMVGFALGQLLGGILSDRRGRKPVLLAGLVCYIAAGVACALSQTGDMLVVSRFVQGLGAGACSIQAFAMVQDLFEGAAARTQRSYVTVVFGTVPMFAPALGSLLSGLAGWRSVYGVLAFGSILLLLVTWLGVGESRWVRARVLAPSNATNTNWIWQDWTFVGFAAANALSYGSVFAYIAGSPIIIIGQLGYSSAVFAGVFASTAAALTAGAWTSGRLGRRLGAHALLGPSLMAAVVATFALAVASVAGTVSGMVFVPLLLVMAFTRGIIAPNLQQLAIERRPEQAGVASSIVGVSQLLSGALASAIVAALLSRLGLAAVGLPMAMLSLAALLVWRWTIFCAKLPVSTRAKV